MILPPAMQYPLDHLELSQPKTAGETETEATSKSHGFYILFKGLTLLYGGELIITPLVKPAKQQKADDGTSMHTHVTLMGFHQVFL